jgi:UDP-GlcNAc3NAcA epimerase
MKIITVVGARPQFVKAAVVSRAIIEHNKENPQNLIEEKIIHTGQHYDQNMSDVFFEEMEIPRPVYTLGIGGGSHGAMTGRQLEKIEEVLIEEQPDYVLVYGDTNSTLAGALAAAKLHIPVVHVEAGLRSFNMRMPEEINRILTDQISSILFCPTETAVKNLENEGFARRPSKIYNIGDVMYDAAKFYENKNTKPVGLAGPAQPFALVTIHRAENTDDLERLSEIVAALNELSKEMSVIFPLHPRTRGVIEKAGLTLNVTILDPVSYFEMLWLLKNCSFVVTDSGGLQKEAYFFKKNCITLREQTEWVETVTSGWNQLVSADIDSMLAAVKKIRNDLDWPELYGNGSSADELIFKLISNC